MVTQLARKPVRWPSQLSVASSDGCLSPSRGKPGALNIFRAAEAGDVDVITAYLSGGGNANKAEKRAAVSGAESSPPDCADMGEGYTILHLAAMRDQTAVVELLLERGADPDVHDKKEGLTPLMWAAQLGHARVTTALLEGGADTEQEDKEDLTALHWAARMGKEQVVETLLGHLADVEAVDYDGNTPLIWAVREGHRSSVNTLLDSGASTKIPDENGNTALHFACQLGHAEIASDLLDWGALATAQDYWQFTPFHRACSQGHGPVLVELLRTRGPGGARKASGDGDGGGDDVMGSGEEGCAVSTMGAVGLDTRGSDALYSLPGLSSEIVDLRNHFHATPLHRAAAKGHAEVVSMLLQNGADVNARDGFFYTPLHLACVNGATACVDVLLRAGADPTPKAQGAVTPLLAARKPEVRELVRKALDARGASASKNAAVEACSTRGSELGHEEGKGNGSPQRTGGSGSGSSSIDASIVEDGGRESRRPDGHQSLPPCENGPAEGAVRVRTLPQEHPRADTIVVVSDADSEDAKRPSANTADDAMDVAGDDDRGWPAALQRSCAVTASADGGRAAVASAEMATAAAASSSASASARGRTPLARGRPVSRLPREDARSEPSGAGFIGRRRSSTGSMLKKVFSGSPASSRSATWGSGLDARDNDDDDGVGDVRPALFSVALCESGNSGNGNSSSKAGAEASEAVGQFTPGLPAPALLLLRPPTLFASGSAPGTGVGESTATCASVSAGEDDRMAEATVQDRAVSVTVPSPPASLLLGEQPAFPAVSATVGATMIHPAEDSATLPPAGPRTVAEAGMPDAVEPEKSSGDANAAAAAAVAAGGEAQASTSGDECAARSSSPQVVTSDVSTTAAGNGLRVEAPVRINFDAVGRLSRQYSRVFGFLTGEASASQREETLPTRAGASVAADAAVALATPVETAAGERRPASFRKRRAKSLPPYFGKHGQVTRALRKPRLESRPCMEGPTAVIETLRLDDAADEDTAVSCWLRGVCASRSASGGNVATGPRIPGVQEGVDGTMSPSSMAPLRRATTLVG